MSLPGILFLIILFHWNISPVRGAEISCRTGWYACYNGATCHDYDYKCYCAPGFSGVTCEINFDDCVGHECKHGACVDLVAGYKCDCDEGFAGSYCEEHIDQCKLGTHKCQNGAKCIDNPEGAYSCDCPIHEKYKYPLFEGYHCENRVNHCTAWPLNLCGVLGDCVNASNADGFTCDCWKGFTGTDCTLDIDECERETHECGVHGQCKNTFGSYRCNCDLGMGQGFRCKCSEGKIGLYCQLDDPCIDNPCGIDGKCVVDASNGSFVCECSPGITGARCELDLDECVGEPCLNNGTCVNVHGSYRCECDNFYGRNCEHEISESADLCERFSCAAKAQNARCDVECNVFACAFDGGDCSSADERPFSACSQPGYCLRAFRDGHCDPECASEECLFDGFDCDRVLSHRCSPKNEKYCKTHFANGKCNRNCNSIGCGWDGGDCLIESQQDERFNLKDHIAIVFLTDAEVLSAGLTSILMLLNRELKALVTVARDYRNRPMIYHWDNVNLSQNRIDLEALHESPPTPNPLASLHGILVRFSVDTNVCHEWNRDDCFTDVHTVASFLSTPPIRESFAMIGFDVESVFAAEAPQLTTHHFLATVFVIATALIIIFLFTSLLVVTLRRARRRKAPRNISLHFDVNQEEVLTITRNGNTESD